MPLVEDKCWEYHSHALVPSGIRGVAHSAALCNLTWVCNPVTCHSALPAPCCRLRARARVMCSATAAAAGSAHERVAGRPRSTAPSAVCRRGPAAWFSEQ